MPTVAELDIEVNLKDNGTQAEILKLEQMLQRLATEDPDISVRVSADAAKREFDDLVERVTLLDAQSVFIDTESDAEVALAQLEELQRAMRGLDRSTVNVDVDLDTQGALAQIAALKVALKSIRDEKVDIDPDGHNAKTLNQISAAAQRASGTVRGLTTAVLGLGPALVPIAAVGVTGLLGLTAGFAAAGAGATLFGAVTLTAFARITDTLKKMKTAQLQYDQAVTDEQKTKALEKLKALYEALDPAEQKVVDRVGELKAEWADFVDKFKPEIFQMTVEALDAMSAAIPRLTPLMQAATKAIHQLQTESLKAFQSDTWQTFFKNLETHAGSAILSIGRSIGNLVTGFAGILNAFFPFSDSLTGGLENLTKKFADWGTSLADNPGFKKFIEYVQDNTPKVTGFIAAFSKAIVDLIIAAAPLGSIVLSAVTQVMQAFSKLVDINPIIGSVILALIAIGAFLLNLIGPILAVANIAALLGPVFAAVGGGIEVAAAAVAGFLGAWGLVIAIVAAAIAGLILAYQHIDIFREKVDALWQKLVELGQGILNAVRPALDAVISFFKDEWQKFVSWWNDNSSTFGASWENIKTAVGEALGAVVDIISNSLDVIVEIWSAIWPGLSTVLSGVWEAIKGILSGAFQIIRGIFTVFAAIIAGDWSKIWGGLGDILLGAWTIIWGILRGAVMVVWGILQMLWGIVVAAWDLIKQAFVNGASASVGFLQDLFSGIGSFFGGLWDGIVAQAENFVNIIVGFFQWLYDVLVGNSIVPDLVNAIIEWWNTLSAFLTSATQPIVDVVVAAFQFMYDTVVSVVTTMVSVASAIWQTLVSVASAVFNAVYSVVSTVISAVSAVVISTITAISTTWSAIWSAIQTVASVVWNLILTAIRVAIQAVQAIIAATLAIIQGNWSGAWNIISTAATSIWNTIKSTVQNAITTVSTTITNVLNTIKSAWSEAWSTLLSKVKEIASQIISSARQLASDLVSAFSGLASRMYDAGVALLTGLANGIKSAGSSAVSAAKDVINSIAGLLPGSPAEWGPLSGHGYVKLRGQRFIEDLNSGLQNTTALSASMTDIADLMTLDLNPSAAYDAIANSTAGAFGSAGSAGSSSTVTVSEGAVQIVLGSGVDPAEARAAFDGAVDTLATSLLSAVQKR